MDMIGFRLTCIQRPILSPKHTQCRRPVNQMGSKIVLFYNVNDILMLFELLLLVLHLTLRCQNPNVLYLQLFVNRKGQHSVEKRSEVKGENYSINFVVYDKHRVVTAEYCWDMQMSWIRFQKGRNKKYVWNFRGKYCGQFPKG